MAKATEPAEDLDHLRSVVEQHARQLAELLQQEAAELARFRRSFGLAAKHADPVEAIQAQRHALQRLLSLMTAHATYKEDLRCAMDELERRVALETLPQERPLVSKPESIPLPGVTLEVTCSWQEQACRIDVTARNSSSLAPLPGVRIDVRSHVASSRKKRIATDSNGRAEMLLDANTSGLLVWLDDLAKPWLIEIDQRREPSTR